MIIWSATFDFVLLSRSLWLILMQKLLSALCSPLSGQIHQTSSMQIIHIILLEPFPKKLSHPGPGPVSTNPKINIESSPRRGFSTFIPCIDGGDGSGSVFKMKKKNSKEGSNKNYNYRHEVEDEERSAVTCSVTHSLESAVRKLSRTSPNRSEMTGIRAGLAILARGYEQYREGIQLLRSKLSRILF